MRITVFDHSQMFQKLESKNKNLYFFSNPLYLTLLRLISGGQLIKFKRLSMKSKFLSLQMHTPKSFLVSKTVIILDNGCPLLKQFQVKHPFRWSAGFSLKRKLISNKNALSLRIKMKNVT